MGLRRLTLALVSLVCVQFTATSRAAEVQDAGYIAAVHLLSQSTNVYDNGLNDQLLLGLRKLDDPTLKPFFQGLTGSPSAAHRIHARLGLAAISPKKRIDLAELAEITNRTELVAYLSTALDDNLLDKEQIQAMLSWEDLDDAIRIAMAVAMVGQGQQVDPAPYRRHLDRGLPEDATNAQIAEYAFAGLLFAEQKDPAGKAALKRIVDLGDRSQFAIVKLLQYVERYDLYGTAEMMTMLAGDSKQPWEVQSRALRAALRMNAAGASNIWRSRFKAAEDYPTLLRLSLIAMDGAKSLTDVDISLMENNSERVVKLMGVVARAIRENHADLAGMCRPLIETGQAMPAMWLMSYCDTVKPPQSPELLELVIRNCNNGDRYQQNSIRIAAMDSVQRLCERFPQRATEMLPAFLKEPASSGDADLMRWAIVLRGANAARGVDLSRMAAAIGQVDKGDTSITTLQLILSAKHNAPLTPRQWQRISDLVQGAGDLEPAFRIQLAWMYLKHLGKADQAAAAALSG